MKNEKKIRVIVRKSIDLLSDSGLRSSLVRKSFGLLSDSGFQPSLVHPDFAFLLVTYSSTSLPKSMMRNPRKTIMSFLRFVEICMEISSFAQLRSGFVSAQVSTAARVASSA